MNCFNHPDKPAIGICKACNKGICLNCATDLDHGLACKDKHEEMVESVNTIIQGNAKVYSNVDKNMIVAPIFYIFMGLVFAGYGYLQAKDGLTSLPFILGLGFIIFGVVSYVRNKATFKSNET